MNREELLKNAKPILFNTEMVQAILEGRKTVTRRAVKGFIPEEAEFGYTMFTPKNSISCRGKFGEIGYDSEQYGEKFFKLPYKVGDILYVRETWQCFNPYSDKEYVYKATNDYSDVNNMKWLPSIHMPKEIARIFLKIRDVRVERLKNITDEQAKNEGITVKWDNGADRFTYPWEEFMHLWNSTIKKQNLDKYCWRANPWVWVIEFERVS